MGRWAGSVGMWPTHVNKRLMHAKKEGRRVSCPISHLMHAKRKERIRVACPTSHLSPTLYAKNREKVASERIFKISHINDLFWKKCSA